MYKITLNKRIYIYKSCYKVYVQLPSSHSVTKSSFGYKLYIWLPSLRPAAKFTSGHQVSIRLPSFNPATKSTSGPQGSCLALLRQVWPKQPYSDKKPSLTLIVKVRCEYIIRLWLYCLDMVLQTRPALYGRNLTQKIRTPK